VARGARVQLSNGPRSGRSRVRRRRDSCGNDLKECSCIFIITSFLCLSVRFMYFVSGLFRLYIGTGYFS
jgi:hypothetical protein